ncbi:MAG: RAMP superfamily CRISPR-associated protein [Gemmatimonadota bacterium]
MTDVWLRITLLSATTIGGGEGMPAEVDVDVEYDEWGLPFIGGRRLKGLLVEEAALILGAFPQAEWVQAAEWLFGRPADARSISHFRIADGQLLPDVRAQVREAVEAKRASAADILGTLTEIRAQTAIDPTTGAPLKGTLRRTRALRRGLNFYSPIDWGGDPGERPQALLAGCALAVRRIGLGRSRGKGAVSLTLVDADGNDLTRTWAQPLLAAGGHS